MYNLLEAVRNCGLMLCLVILMGMTASAQAADTTSDLREQVDQGVQATQVEKGVAQASLLAKYGDTYTQEELAALSEILWAANMTLEDLQYKKDYTKGHGCFPAVREMMHDPLLIAPWMDEFALNKAEAPPGFFPTSHLKQAVFIFSGNYYGVAADDDLPRPEFTSPFPYNSVLDYMEILIMQDLWFLQDFPTDSHSRAALLSALAWHEFEQSTLLEGEESAIEDSDQFEKYSTFEPDSNSLVLLNRFANFSAQFGHTALELDRISQFAWPLNEPIIRDTPNGRLCIGTLGDDYYEGDFAVLIEPGGNDTYKNCRIGAAYGAPTPELGNGQVGYFVDLGGDDFYDCGDVNITLGAAVLGVAAFYDLGGGDDRYYAGSCSLGAAMGGIATFYDDGGSDFYSGKVFTQGAAGFGIGIMIDDAVGDAPVFDTAEGNDALVDNYETGESDVDTHSLMDNDYYTAWSNAQAFARPRGVALCINKRGNETYHAGGVYLHAPLFGDRYQSFSQGFAIGERGIDWAGGIAMLIDYDGNDRYLGDIYNQGVGYWYGAGLLWDGGGNDTYEMTQYGQGSGIHLAVGGLVDVAGNDSYIMHSGLGQGSSHDLAVSVLHDRGGNDRYHGNTTCNGSSLTGSASLFIDRSGNDTYAGRRASSINYGDGRRTNIGMFIDLAGEDDYMIPLMGDGGLWKHTNIGVGLDWDEEMYPTLFEDQVRQAAVPVESEGLQAEPPAVPSEDDASAEAEPEIPIPEICAYEGELSQEVFDQLWEISVRWAVGDNATIVPHGRQRLIEFGPAVLPYLSEMMDDSNSGLALRAFVEIYTALWEEDADGVASVLRENAADMDDTTRRKNALYLIGELKQEELGEVALIMLDDPDPSLQRRAIGVIGALGSHAADERLIAMLDPSVSDEPTLSAVLTTLTNLEVDCYEQLRPLLGYELFTVREALIKQLVAHPDAYREYFWADFVNPNLVGDRGLRSVITVFTKLDTMPDEGLLVTVPGYLTADDWGIRGDAVRVVRHWQELAAEDAELTELIAPAVAAMDDMLLTETHPYVLGAAE